MTGSTSGEKAIDLETGSRADPYQELVRADRQGYRGLLERAEKVRTAIHPSLLALHVLSVTRDADRAVRESALEATLRRLAFARSDELQVEERPSRGRAFGHYTTSRSSAQGTRPYCTLLCSIDPLLGSCDCPDFLRNSLALCKHLLVVLEDLFADSPRLERALAGVGALAPERGTELLWSPLRPLSGYGDWLERVTLFVGNRSQLPVGPLRKARRWFVKPKLPPLFAAGGLRPGELVLRESLAERPDKRLQLVEDLLGLLRSRPTSRSEESYHDPALLALLRQERERLLPLVPHSQECEARRLALRTLKLRLYPFQREGVDALLRSGHLLLADDMGLGKTAQAIAACHVLWNSGRVGRGLLVVPASLKAQWLSEWQRFTDAPARIVEGPPARRRSLYRRRNRGFLIANYEQVLRDLDLMLAWQPDLTVLDEAQRIKNWATKTSVSIKQLNPAWRLVLTGTPMENRLEELASLFDWVDSFALEPKWRLAPFHTSGTGPGPRKAQHLGTLRSRLSGRMLRRRRKEVLGQLPPRTDTTIPVPFSAEQRHEHDLLQQPIAELTGILSRRPLAAREFSRLMSLLTTQRIIANGLAQLRFPEVWPQIEPIRDPGPALLESLSCPKLVELREILGQLALQQGRKVVVFSQWRRMLILAHWAVRAQLEDAGVRAAFFTGRESLRQRQRALDEFHEDPAVRVLLASDAGGVGLNLQRAASACINLEPPWNPAVLEQRVSRIHRMGQDRPIDVFALLASDSIEERIAQLAKDKQALFEGLFDGSSDEILFDRSHAFLETLHALTESGAGTSRQGRLPGFDEAQASVEEEIDKLVESADESGDPEPGPGLRPEAGAAPAGPASAAEIAELLAGLKVSTETDGRIHLEAPPEEARRLADLLEGLARLLRSQNPRDSAPDP